MKKLTIIIFILNYVMVSAQDIQLTFSPNNSQETIDKIEIIKIETSERFTISDTNIVVLNVNSSTSEIIKQSEISVTPNPFNGSGSLEYTTNKNETILIQIVNFSGQILTETKCAVNPGINRFNLKCEHQGMFYINVLSDFRKSSCKIINLQTVKSINKIQYEGNFPSELKEKSTNNSEGVLYHFLIYSGDKITLIADTPSQSKTYNVDFFECNDNDGNIYPVVQIGIQLWIAENLKYLPALYPEYDDWTLSDLPNYYVYDYEGLNVEDAKNTEEYEKLGVLYNWAAAITACPEGWHLPSNDEWEILARFTSDNKSEPYNSGYHLKSTIGWIGTNGINDVGFNAIAAGLYPPEGNFSDVGNYGFWWTADLGNPDNMAITRFMYSNSDELVHTAFAPDRGLSVRCIMGDSAFVTESVVSTEEIKSITCNSAASGGRVTDSGGIFIIGKGVCWNKTGNPTIFDDKTIDGVDTTAFVSEITGLDYSTTYYVRSYSKTRAGVTYGEQKMFTTSDPIPQVETSYVSDTTLVSAIVFGKVLSDGCLPLLSRGFCLNTTGNPSLADSVVYSGNGKGDFSETLKGLKPATTYYVKAFATNEQETGYGEELTFKTPNPPVLIVTTAEISHITGFSATGGGIIIIFSDDFESIIAEGLVWDTIPTPTVLKNSGITNNLDIYNPESFVSRMDNLKDSTAYYVRAYAINVVDTVYGNEVEFTTRMVSIPAVRILKIRDISNHSATCYVEITDDGNDMITYKGVVWDTIPEPSVDKYAGIVSDSTDSNKIIAELTGLTDSTRYYIRAFAMNRKGLTYTPDSVITTFAEVSTNQKTLLDQRDGKSYRIVKIGTQWWMAENLAHLPSVFPPSDDSVTEPYQYVYGYTGYNTEEARLNDNYSLYGVLYNWIAAKEACPVSWHLPSDDEWKQLELFIGINRNEVDDSGYRGTDEGKKLKAVSGWYNDISPEYNGTDDYNFTALPGGWHDGRNFSYIGRYGSWWSNTDAMNYSGSMAWCRLLWYPKDDIGRYIKSISSGYSVRCVKNDAFALKISTNQITDTTSISAISGGKILTDGGVEIAAKGLCWNKTGNPTILDSKIETEPGNDNFIITVTGLEPNTTYYIRAYASNNEVLVYGSEQTFKTRN